MSSMVIHVAHATTVITRLPMFSDDVSDPDGQGHTLDQFPPGKFRTLAKPFV